MSEIEVFVTNTPVGKIQVTLEQSYVSRIDLNTAEDIKLGKSDLAMKVSKQIDNYFSDPLFEFKLPLKKQGTSHQLKVWKALTQIPVGKRLTYGEMAKQIKSSARAVGGACRNNPIPIIVPCHRVVAANALGGFAGSMGGRLLEIKRDLLSHEGIEY